MLDGRSRSGQEYYGASRTFQSARKGTSKSGATLGTNEILGFSRSSRPPEGGIRNCGFRSTSIFGPGCLSRSGPDSGGVISTREGSGSVDKPARRSIVSWISFFPRACPVFLSSSLFPSGQSGFKKGYCPNLEGNCILHKPNKKRHT